MPLSETVLLLMGLLAAGVLVRGLFGSLPVPYTVMLVLVGLVLGHLARSWQPLEPLQSIGLSPELVLFVFLPILIFESGFGLNARQMGKQIIPILVLAIPALLLSTTIVGLGVWLLLPLDLTTALVFGALISATDPVAVVSLFKELGTPLRLTVLVEGESLFNDATAIVLFSILLGLAVRGGFEPGQVGFAVIQFLEVFIGGSLLGLGFGLLTSWLVIRLELETSSVLVCSVILAFAAFIVAEHSLHISGVMAVVTAAISFAVFAAPRLAEEIVHVLHKTWEFLADTANTLLFLLIGLSVNLPNLLSITGFVLLTALLVMGARAFSVYGFVPLTVALFRLPEVTWGERHVMWWGGLKGGLAIAVVLSIPEELAGRELLLNLTLGVVLFSLLVNAPTIRPLIKKLGMDRLSDEEEAELGEVTQQAFQHSNSVLRRLLDKRILSKAGHYQAQNAVEECLQHSAEIVSIESRQRNQRLDVLREEGAELERLYSAGVIPQYSFLDIKAELQGKSDRVANPERNAKEIGDARTNLFHRFENMVLRRFRESNWASNLLAYYQNMRVSQHIVKDMVRILMAEAAVEHVEQRLAADPLFDSSILTGYQDRLMMLHENIADYQRDFNAFYQRFESRFARRTALISVLRDIQDRQRKAAISDKVFVQLAQSIHRALDQIPVILVPPVHLKNEELISLVPLFANLSDDALGTLARKVTSVSYLPGDIIVGEGEHGDALYIMVKGRVRVSHGSDKQETVLADLVEGDFFGEMALLGTSIRKATVTAIHACTLLRLRASEVMEIAKQKPEIGDYLERLKSDREADSSDRG